ncbi:MAG: DUF3179 domain-containing protein [Candidatus Thorarchaeota archaeon]
MKRTIFLIFITFSTTLVITFNFKLISGRPLSPTNPCGPELVSGGVSKDGIPAIDSPKFITIEEFESTIGEDYSDKFILGVEINGSARAYPIDILTWHEIVNDRIGDATTFSVTYCPLTASGILFHTSSIGGSTLGTTGYLYENNLVFYDRKTDTFWNQMYGIVWCGELDGALDRGNMVETTWKTWKTLYPDTLILSRNTGYHKNYNYNPYGSYDSRDTIFFPSAYRFGKEPYNWFPIKERSYILQLEAQTFVFPFQELMKTPIVNVSYGTSASILVSNPNTHLVVAFNSELPDGTILDFTKGTSLNNDEFSFQDKSGTTWNLKGKAISGPLKGQSLKPLPGYIAYWFAASVFYTQSKIYINESFVDHPTGAYLIPQPSNQAQTTSGLMILESLFFAIVILAVLRIRRKIV